MIKVLNDYFILETKNTSYVFKKIETGHLLHLYYGSKIDSNLESLESLEKSYLSSFGNNIYYSDDKKEINFEVMPQEVSTFGKGDMRNPMIKLLHKNGVTTTDLRYDTHEVTNVFNYKDMPSVKDDLKEGECLLITLKDFENKVTLKLAYNVFSKDDVITRKHILINESKEELEVLRAFSNNLDLRNNNYQMRSFHGAWANEMNVYDRDLVIGRTIAEALTGTSSARCNPFIMIHSKGAQEDSGEVFGFNLLYSGNHQESAEVDFFNNARVLQGMNPETFRYILKPNESLEIPESVMSYSPNGYRGLSLSLHSFIMNHIVEENFRFFPRKVLNNSWEACYFNFNEKKLVKMAKCAKSLGCELFVLDDGWFGKRDNDTSSLGDWTENRKKLPSGLKGLSHKINRLGLDFGIWVEPEMVSENSDLFRAHPNWVVRIPGHPHSLGRNQMILDLSNKDVENYLVDSISYVIHESGAKYVKWDMNRPFSDYFSQNLNGKDMTSFEYRYYKGLYSIMRRIKDKYPNVLFEGCASGGNRFDLGILSYMPQIWASDDTDPFVRARMQYNYSYGYPLQTLGCHVASSPCLSTLRKSSIEDRFNIAFPGAFGYEVDLRKESRGDKKKIKSQILFYKQIRDKLITSSFYRIKSDEKDIVSCVTSKDKSLSLLVEEILHHDPIDPFRTYKVYGLDKDKNYKCYTKEKVLYPYRMGIDIGQVLSLKIPGFIQNFIKIEEGRLDYKTSGSILMNSGLNINNTFSGAGLTKEMRFCEDNSTRLYIIEEV